MRLTRFNEFVVAVAGTVVTLGTVLLVGMVVLDRLEQNEPPPGLAIETEEDAAAGRKKPPQNLVFCAALTDSTSTYQYIPVAAVVAEDAERDPVLRRERAPAMAMMLHADSTSSLVNCGSGYSGDYRAFNVVVRTLASNTQRLLLDGPAQVLGVDLPDAKCAMGEGRTPCDRLLWWIRSADTSKDGAINERDALVVYSSGLDAERLTARTPADATVLDIQWVHRTGAWQFRIRRDANKDGQYSEEDGSELLEAGAAGTTMAQPFVQESIRNALDSTIR